MKSRFALVTAATLAVIVGSAHGQSTVIFTDVVDGTGNPGSFIKTVDTPGNVVTRVTFAPGAARLSDIKPGAVAGEYIYGNGPFPPGGNPNVGTGSINRVTNLFGAPVTGQIDTGSRAWNPIGLRYDAGTNSVLYNDNLAGGFFDGVVSRSFRGVNYSTGVNSRLMQERQAIPGVVNPTPEGRAWAEGGAYLVPDPVNPGAHYVMSTTGGRFVGPFLGRPNRNVSSVIWRVTTDGVTDGSGTNTGTTFTEVIDTAAAAFPRSSDPLTNLNFTDFRGITAKPGVNSLFVTSNFYNAIFRIDLSGTGTFVSATQLTTTGVDEPEAIEYDPFTDTLVYANVGATKNLVRINLDGSNATVLATGVHVRGITFIPAPGAAAALGLGMLAFARRRR